MSFSNTMRAAPIDPRNPVLLPIVLPEPTASLMCTACLGKEFTLSIEHVPGRGRIGILRCEKCRQRYVVSITKEVK